MKTFGRSLYTVLNVSFPKTVKSEVICLTWTLAIFVHPAAALAPAVPTRARMLSCAINNNPNQVAVGFSFSKNKTKVEIDVVVEKLKTLI